jgi:hypothetical protein
VEYLGGVVLRRREQLLHPNGVVQRDRAIGGDQAVDTAGQVGDPGRNPGDGPGAR